MTQLQFAGVLVLGWILIAIAVGFWLYATSEGEGNC